MVRLNNTMNTPESGEGPGRFLKHRLRNSDVLVGGMVAEHLRPSLVKLYVQAGFDFMYIEYEHGFFEMTTFADSVLCARDNNLPVIAKTPQLERAEVAKLLECGVVGIQLPPHRDAGRGRNASQLPQVSASRYASGGARLWQ